LSDVGAEAKRTARYRQSMLVTGESTIGRCEPTYHAENRERAKMEIADRLTHLLPHWIEHNEAHAEQLAEWVAKARSAGMGEIADSISAAADAMRQANARLTHSRWYRNGEHPTADRAWSTTWRRRAGWVSATIRSGRR